MSRTQQEVVDTVAKHLREQGGRSGLERDGEFVCAYRGDGGRKCSIGCLLSDKEFRPVWEGLGVTHEMAILIYRRTPSTDERLILERLQLIHDKAPPQDEWQGWINPRLRALCTEFDLVYPEPS